MVSGPGRDQRGPMERLVRIAAMLQVHGEKGVDGETLARIAGFDGADPGTQLKRELRHLANHGWQIDNIAPPGSTAVYRMTTVDNRLRVRLTPAQQSALRRAVLLADRGDLVERLGLPDSARPSEVAAPAPAAVPASPAALAVVLDALRDRRVLHFSYKGTARVVHPESVRNQNGTWYLRGVEEADLSGGPGAGGEVVVKTFVVGRMAATDVGAPGSAGPVPSVRHSGLHPMTWEIDPPVEVTLEAAATYAPDVRRWLGEPESVAEADGVVRMRYLVTHRAALRTRLNELGRRVRIVGPPEVRAEVVAALAEAAGIDEPVEGVR